MKVSPAPANQLTFKSYSAIGRNSDSIERILKPYEKKLNQLTQGFDVYINDGISLYLHNEALDEMVSLCGTKISIEPKHQSVNRFLQKVELTVNPAADPSSGSDVDAKNIITTIKKGVDLFKNFFT